MERHDSETLKQSIELLERKVEFLFKHCNVVFEESWRDHYLSEAEELLRDGRDNEAMKIVREQDAIGLVEARDLIERMKAGLGLLGSPIPDDETAAEQMPHDLAIPVPTSADGRQDTHGGQGGQGVRATAAGQATAEVDPAIEEWKASAEQWKDAIEGWTSTDPSETIVYDPADDDESQQERAAAKPAAWRPNVNNGLGKYFRKQRFEE